MGIYGQAPGMAEATNKVSQEMDDFLGYFFPCLEVLYWTESFLRKDDVLYWTESFWERMMFLGAQRGWGKGREKMIVKVGKTR